MTRIGPSDHGATIELAVGELAFLRLPDDRAWTEPATDQEVVLVVPLQAVASDGYQRWELRAMTPGTTDLHAAATSACPPVCPSVERGFTVELVVRDRPDHGDPADVPERSGP